MSLIFCCPLPAWPFINYLCTAIIKIEGKQIRKSAYLSTGFNQGRTVTGGVSVFEKKKSALLEIFASLYNSVPLL